MASDPLASTDYTPTDSTPDNFVTKATKTTTTKSKKVSVPKLKPTVKYPKGTGLKGLASSMKMGSKSIKALKTKAYNPKMGRSKPIKYVAG